MKRINVYQTDLTGEGTWRRARPGSSRQVGPHDLDPSHRQRLLTRYNYSLQHYGPETYNKNFIYSGDNWLFAERWEHLIANRAHVDMVEVLTWSTSYRMTTSASRHRPLNFRHLDDYGESHYIGPIEGAQPMSEGWVDGFDHQGTPLSDAPRFSSCVTR